MVQVLPQFLRAAPIKLFLQRQLWTSSQQVFLPTFIVEFVQGVEVSNLTLDLTN